MLWADILEPEAIENSPGTKLEFYFAERSSILTWPTLIDAPAAVADFNTIATDFTFQTGGMFNRIYVTPKRGKVENEAVGPDDCKTFKHSFEFFHPGNSDEIEAFMRQVKNKKLAVIAVEKDGTQRLVGQVDTPAMIESITGGTGGTPEDEKGHVFRVVSDGNEGPAPKYTGMVPVTPAV